MSAPSLSTEAAAANGHPNNRYNQRERQLLQTVKTYVDAADAVVLAGATPADLSVTEGKIAALAVTNGKLGADCVTNAKIADGAVSVEHLDSGIAPSHIVKFAGKHTTVGGAAAEVIAVAGVAATDIVLVTLQTEGAGTKSIVKAIPGTNEITVTFSADPSNDHIVSYLVLRAAT